MFKVDDYHYDGDTYSLTQIPNAESKLVGEAKKDLLGNLNLPQLVVGLQRSGRLLYLAACGVTTHGTLMGFVDSVQEDLAGFCGKCDTTLSFFASASKKIQEKLLIGIQYLLYDDLDLCCKTFALCSSVAQELVDRATMLTNEAISLQEQAKKSLNEVEKTEDLDTTLKKEIEKQITDLKAKTEGDKQRVAEMQKTEALLTQEFNDIKEECAKSEGRAFEFSMTTAALSVVGAVASAVTSVFIAKQTGSLQRLPDPPSEDQTGELAKKKEEAELAKDSASKDRDSKKKKLDEVTKLLNDAKSNQTEKEAHLKEAKEKYEKASHSVSEKNDGSKGNGEKETAIRGHVITESKLTPSQVLSARLILQSSRIKKTTIRLLKSNANTSADGDGSGPQEEPTLAELKAAVEVAEDELNTANEAVVNINKKVKELKEVWERANTIFKHKKEKLDEIVKAASSASKAAAQVSESYIAHASKLQEQRKNYLQLLVTQKNQEADILGGIQESVSKMKSYQIQDDTLGVAIQGLSITIRALRQVVATLQGLIDFWSKLKDGVQQMASERMEDTVANWENLKRAKKAVFINQDLFFKEPMIRSLAHWKAIELVCQDFAKQTSDIEENVLCQLEHGPIGGEDMSHEIETTSHAISLDNKKQLDTAEDILSLLEKELKS